MNQQPQKRRNPFEKMKFDVIEDEKIDETSQEEELETKYVENSVIEEQQNQQEPQEEVKYQAINQQYYQPQPQYAPQKAQNRQQQSQNRVVSRQTKNYYTDQEVVVRDKFTSTMEQSLRRAIKVVCAQRGIMFAQFVEEACREKLNREGRR